MQISLTQNRSSDCVIAWNEQGSISYSQYLTDVIQLVKILPDKKFAINLCEERYSFMVAFAAVIVKQQTNLLPQSRVVANINEVAKDNPDNYCITEAIIDGLEIEQTVIDYKVSASNQVEIDFTIKSPTVDAAHIAAIVYTSGSTGKPQANNKTWGALVSGACRSADGFGFVNNPVYIVATVPPQHMYGLETSILYCLHTECAVYAGRPFYPDDIRSAVESTQQQVVLVTTPVHLRACNGAANIVWSNIKSIISATALLRIELAKQVSEKMKTTVMEIFGCTETGAIASREPLKSELWRLFGGISISCQNNKTLIHGAYNMQDIELSDIVEIVDGNTFKLVGRDQDMVNIAGKRGSLADLTLKLQSIKDVDDAVVYFPESNNEVNRLIAFVVSKNIDEKAISTELAKKVDRVFLPRPIYRVSSLPYNDTGKLAQKDLYNLHQKCKNSKK